MCALPNNQSPVAFVTGGSRGIGKATSLALARDGYNIVVNYQRNEDAANTTVAEIERLGRTAIPIKADVSDAEEVDRMIRKGLEVMGRVDVMVINAGIGAVVDLEDLSVEEWDRVVATNLRGAFICAKGAVRIMRRQGHGRLILLASQAAFTGGLLIGAHYVASKAGIVALTKHLAKKLAASDILVNCVAPGIVETDMTRSYGPEQLRDLVAKVPLGRVGTADEVARVVAFLCGDGGAYMTGSTIHVNGGLYMA